LIDANKKQHVIKQIKIFMLVIFVLEMIEINAGCGLQQFVQRLA
jgi:hypothetical protein